MAKLYGGLLKEWGLLSRGDLIVKTPKDFASTGTVGDAEGKVLEVLNSARGCVLLIDEAVRAAAPLTMPKRATHLHLLRRHARPP